MSAGLAAALVSVALVVTGQLLLKAGMSLVGPIGMSRLAAPLRLGADVFGTWQVLAGLGLYVVSAGLWVYALASVPLSVAYPLLSLSYVGVAVAARTALGERATGVQWAGILLIAGGTVLVFLSR